MATPTANPGGGYINSVNVTLATNTSGASIYYTLDDTAPTEGSFEYNNAISITTDTRLRARAFKSGDNPRGELVRDYTINPGNSGLCTSSSTTAVPSCW